MRFKTGAGMKLHETRERLGLSRKEVEERTKANGFRVHDATIANIEKGVSKNPYPRNIFALADVYGLDTSELFEAEAPEEVAS